MLGEDDAREGNILKGGEILNWKARFRNKWFYVFLAALGYRVCQDIGVAVPLETYKFYVDAALWLMTFFGIIIDFSTPGAGDPPAKLDN